MYTTSIDALHPGRSFWGVGKSMSNANEDGAVYEKSTVAPSGRTFANVSFALCTPPGRQLRNSRASGPSSPKAATRSARVSAGGAPIAAAARDSRAATRRQRRPRCTLAKILRFWPPYFPQLF